MNVEQVFMTVFVAYLGEIILLNMQYSAIVAGVLI